MFKCLKTRERERWGEMNKMCTSYCGWDWERERESEASSTQAVWTDEGIKAAHFLKKCCPKSCHNRFYLSRYSFQSCPKVTRYLGYFVRKFVMKKFQNSPNLVTLHPSWNSDCVEERERKREGITHHLIKNVITSIWAVFLPFYGCLSVFLFSQSSVFVFVGKKKKMEREKTIFCENCFTGQQTKTIFCSFVANMLCRASKDSFLKH